MKDSRSKRKMGTWGKLYRRIPFGLDFNGCYGFIEYLGA
jgi:hypothetical protein